MTAGENTTDVALPPLGEAVTEATITRWLVNVGDRVEQDDPLLEVATDKVDTEIPSPTAGILSAIVELEGSRIGVGAVIARMSDDLVSAGQTPRDTPERPQHALGQQGDSLSPPHPVPTTVSKAPAASRSVGEVTDRVEKLPRIRRTIAQRLLASLQTSAQLTSVVEVDLTAVAAVRRNNKNDFRSRTGRKLSFFPFVVAAAVEQLAHHPVINSSLDPDCTEVTYHGAAHTGIAVETDKGLMVPVIRDSQSLSIAELTHAIADLAEAARTSTITADDLTGGTFTITNTGSRGALFDTPIINQPQSAILGVGSVVERLVPGRDRHGNLLISVRSMAYLSMSYDHRIVDGADAARYLSSVRQRLEAGYSDTDLL
ncbi:MAG: dihydrolipoyllysine succinyltransferase [Comamonadaceae bacterium]|nr:MAG: dihydrolipoyllysine succinyltransferase [Comamonadaceae bacterium]